MNHLEEQCKEEPVFLIGDMEGKATVTLVCSSMTSSL